MNREKQKKALKELILAINNKNEISNKAKRLRKGTISEWITKEIEKLAKLTTPANPRTPKPGR